MFSHARRSVPNSRKSDGAWTDPGKTLKQKHHVKVRIKAMSATSAGAGDYLMAPP